MSYDLRKRPMDSNGRRDDLLNKRLKRFSPSPISIDSHLSRTTTCLDHLPNEIFCEIFDYLSTSDLLYSFFDLNSRLNSIISHLPMKIRFDHRNRLLFKRFLKHIQPDFIPQVVALDFAVSFEPEYMIEKFTEKFHILQFENLRHLSVTSPSYQQLEFLLRLLPQMTQLRSFRLLDRYPLQTDSPEVCQMILANNRQCSLAIRNSSKHITIETSPPFRNLILLQRFLINQIVFTSLDLRIHCAPFFYPQALAHLPLINLVHLVPQMTYCHINLLLGPHTILLPFIRCFPQISHLSIRTRLHAYANGYQWKELLSQLPNIIHLDLNIHSNTSNSDEELISFQTKFWFERQWIVYVKPCRLDSNGCSFRCRTSSFS